MSRDRNDHKNVTRTGRRSRSRLYVSCYRMVAGVTEEQYRSRSSLQELQHAGMRRC